ncbi:MAG: type sorting protein, partial [Bacteroidota bacterium]|nr:type sorting protein [Bacteroidota bacterium]
DTNYSYGSIRFDSIPDTTQNQIKDIRYSALNDFRGKERKLVYNPNLNRDTLLKIYRKMLPIDENNKDITICAHFLTYSDGKINGDNPAFIGNDDPEHNKQIDSLDIEVYYHGITDVCIDFIKIENDEAYYISRGAVDSLGTFGEGARPEFFWIKNKANSLTDSAYYPSIKDVLQTYITRFPKYELNGVQTSPLFRFYTQEDESTNPVWWWQLRYINLLTNGMSTTRNNPIYPKHFEYYTKCPARYIGIKLNEYENYLPVPYLRYHLDSSDINNPSFAKGGQGGL